jgi:coiled-coil domain-containing protein 55
VQKEREAEGEEFKDKESFVTSAYRKKLEEMKEAEEVEKREAYLENIGDVMKQGDLSGFYRHIYEQKMGPETSKKVEVPEEKKKNYRKRKNSDEKEESDEKDDEKVQDKSAEKTTHLPCNLDADSDFEIDSESEDEKKEEKENVSEVPAAATEEPTNGKTEEEQEEVKVIEEPPKPKIDIWKKRTIGEAFDEAVARYYQRKAERGQA